MTILYEGVQGSPPNIVLGILFALAGLVSCIVFLVILTTDKKVDIGAVMLSLAITFAAIISSIVAFSDTRETVVRATIDDVVPFKTINESYEFVKAEGEIYTFRVK